MFSYQTVMKSYIGSVLENRKIDVDSISRWYSYKPKAILKIWILIRVSWRVYGAIHCSYISSTESYRKGICFKNIRHFLYSS